MQMCEGSGNLWWGGLPPREFVVGSSDSASELGVLYTPLYGSSFYTVAPSDIYIGGVSQSLSPSDFAQSEMSSNAVDSGTTMWELPETAYRRVVDALLSDPAFKKYFRASASDNFFDHALDTCESAESAGKLVSYSALQRELPTITVQFTNGLSVTMDGVGRSDEQRQAGASLHARAHATRSFVVRFSDEILFDFEFSPLRPLSCSSLFRSAT
jgi:hypothetical protein